MGDQQLVAHLQAPSTACSEAGSDAQSQLANVQETTVTDLPLLVVQDAQVVQRRRVLRAGLQGALVAQLGLLQTPLDHVVCPCRQQATAGCTQGKSGNTCAK